jgi:hypothetical protein
MVAVVVETVVVHLCHGVNRFLGGVHGNDAAPPPALPFGAGQQLPCVEASVFGGGGLAKLGELKWHHASVAHLGWLVGWVGWIG